MGLTWGSVHRLDMGLRTWVWHRHTCLLEKRKHVAEYDDIVTQVHCSHCKVVSIGSGGSHICCFHQQVSATGVRRGARESWLKFSTVSHQIFVQRSMALYFETRPGLTRLVFLQPVSTSHRQCQRTFGRLAPGGFSVCLFAYFSRP